MRAEDSSTLKTDAAAQITNMPGADGAVEYDWAAADVNTAGRFIFWWQVNLGGGVLQDTPESLITFIEHAPTSRALCTLEDVQSYIPGYIPYSDLSTDTILMEMIESVSVEIHNQTRRDFTPVQTNPYAKVFDVTAATEINRRLFVGDLKNLTGLTVGIASTDGTAIGSTITAPSTAIIGQPRNRQPWEPYNYLWFPAGQSNSASLGAGSVVTVTGNWGFPQIPGDIRQACVKLVINRYLRDVAAGGTAFADAVTDADYALSTAFASAQDTIGSYTFHLIG